MFGYDARGNMTTNAEAGDVAIAMAYAYDLGDKLTAINTAGTAADAAFTYDALGRALTRTVSTSPTATVDAYAYAGTGDTVTGIATTGGTTQTLASLVDPAGTRLGNNVAGSVTWTIPDLHGNAVATVDQAESSIVDALRYDGYGQTVAASAGLTPGARAWKYQGRLDVSPVSTPL